MQDAADGRSLDNRASPPSNPSILLIRLFTIVEENS